MEFAFFKYFDLPKVFGVFTGVKKNPLWLYLDVVCSHYVGQLIKLIPKGF